jgi:hypothetical protein
MIIVINNSNDQTTSFSQTEIMTPKNGTQIIRIFQPLYTRQNYKATAAGRQIDNTIILQSLFCIISVSMVNFIDAQRSVR